MRNKGRALRFETFEPRHLMCSDLGGEPSAILPNATTGFSHAPGTGNYSAMIDLAQNDTQVTSVTVGAGEPSAQSTLRYVSTSGGGGAGTQADPWSLDYANNVVQAGETVLMLGGTYDGILEPKRGGTPGNPITYKPAPGASVHLRAIGNIQAVKIRKEYILVEGFTVSRRDGLIAGGFPRVTDIDIYSNHVTIRNMHVVNNGDHICQSRIGVETGIAINGSYNLIENNYVENMRGGMGLGTDDTNSRYNVVRGNTIADPIYDGIYIGHGTGGALGHLIENNVIFGSMVSDGITFNGRRSSEPTSHIGIREIIIRNNAIFNNAENSIDLKATENIIIEGNYLWGSISDNDGSNVIDKPSSHNALENDEDAGPGGIAKGANTTSQEVIIRNNVMVDSNSGTLSTREFKIYNNTILNNRRLHSGPNQSPTSPGARKPSDRGISNGAGTGPNAAILNNIIGDHGYEIAVYPTGSAAIDGNAYFNTFQSPRFSVFTGNYNWTSETFATWKSWLQTKSNFTGDEANSQVVAGGPGALFVSVPAAVTGDPSQYNFSLRTNSPAINSGVFLTTTTSSGSGTSMTVADGDIFMDGFGITAGDTIQLQGQTQTATITNISGNTLTLSTALSWSSGLGVSLAYEGNKPDVGAIEFTGGFENFPPTAVDDIVTTEKGIATSTGNLVANDTDPNLGDTLFVQSHTLPSHGSLFDIGNGTYAYLPLNGYTGSDSFTYVVSDGVETDTGTVNITITSPGDFDTDGDIDGSDFLSWQRGFGSPYTVDDLTDWQEDYGAGASLAAVAAVATEPVDTDEDKEEAVLAANVSTNAVSFALALDLQTSTSNREAGDILFDDALMDYGYVQAVDTLYAQLAKEDDSLRISRRVIRDIIETEETSDELLDGFFELIGENIV